MTRIKRKKDDVLVLTRDYQPSEWTDRNDAITREVTGEVVAHLGEDIIMYRGGINALTGKQSEVVTSTIIVVDGVAHQKRHRMTALTNSSLFQRDRYMCAYCGGIFDKSVLTCDHVMPVSKGGKNAWMNVVTACKPCNGMKANLMPGQELPQHVWSPQGTRTMDPLYVPYVPCAAEAMIMKGRTILADQMAFLLDRIVHKETSRLYRDLKAKLDAGAKELSA